MDSLHTYAGSPPKTECEFKEIRTVEGKIRKFDFLAEDGEIMIKSRELQCTHVVKTVGAAGGWINYSNTMAGMVNPSNPED